MSAPPHLARLVPTEGMAWGLGQVAEWLDDILEAGHTLSPDQEQAHQACCAVIEEHARWVATRTDRLLRYSTRFPSARHLDRAVAAALVAVAEAGGFDHLFRLTQNAGGSNMVIAPWPPEQRPAARAAGRRRPKRGGA
jgi:hypothetical protein